MNILSHSFRIIGRCREGENLRLLESVFIKHLQPSLNNTESAAVLCIVQPVCLLFSQSLDLGIFSHHPIRPLFTSALRPLQWLATFSLVFILISWKFPLILHLVVDNIFLRSISCHPNQKPHGFYLYHPETELFMKLRYLQCVYYV